MDGGAPSTTAFLFVPVFLEGFFTVVTAFAVLAVDFGGFFAVLAVDGSPKSSRSVVLRRGGPAAVACGA